LLFLESHVLGFLAGGVLPKGFGVTSSLLSGTDCVVPSFLRNSIKGCLVSLQSIVSLWSRPLRAFSSIMLTQTAFIFIADQTTSAVTEYSGGWRFPLLGSRVLGAAIQEIFCI